MKWKGSLDNDSISKAVAQAEKEAEKAGIEGEQRLRFTLSLEETLLICKERCGESAVFSQRMKQRGRQLTAELILPAELPGKFSGEDSPIADLLNEWESETRKGQTRRVYSFLLERTRGDLFRFVWKYTRPHKWWFVLGVITQTIWQALDQVLRLGIEGHELCHSSWRVRGPGWGQRLREKYGVQSDQ